jgi:neutral ceramidase
MIRSVSSLLFILLLAPMLIGAEMSAAVARVDLTPPLEMKSPLGGYGARMNAPAIGVHDRIFAKALLLTDGQRRFVLVTCDMLGLAPPVKQEIVKRLADDGWTSNQLMLLPSHSHASIEMHAINPNNIFALPQVGIHDPKLYEFTVNNFVDLIRRVSALKPVPVKVGTESVQIPGWNRNRRDDSTLTDNELTITRVDTLEDKPLAVLVNYTAHPTFMTEKEMMFSGGWPGALQRTMESLIGDDATVMYYNGAEGDQAPSTRPGSGNSRWEKAARYGLDLGIETAKHWKSIPTQRNVAFGYHLQTIDLPERSWHPDFMSTGGKEYGLTEELLTNMLPRLSPAQTTSGSLRLGQLVVIGIPGEMAAGLGLHVKARAREILGAEHPVIGGLANEWVSYILSEEAYQKGRYEASVSFYGEKLGPSIVQGALAGVANLK